MFCSVLFCSVQSCPVLLCPVDSRPSWRNPGEFLGVFCCRFLAEGHPLIYPEKVLALPGKQFQDTALLLLLFLRFSLLLLLFWFLSFVAGWLAGSISVAGHQKTLQEIHGLGLYANVSMEIEWLSWEYIF